ncbi:MAG: molybdate ABC transporter substrate-binding protein [Xanthomonadaceae bacterium]|nr:molybdate ABC transporter substrate-binding protein [Xanthomonadaceae bacterium]
MTKFLLRILLLASLLSWLGAQLAAAELRAAVAANFAATLERLGQAYARETGTRLIISSAASGKHYAQIRQGAPFDLFFSADDRRSRDLVRSGHALPDSPFVYAEGVLVLWSPTAGRIPQDGLAFLKSDDYPRLAMANPRIAPYGSAAMAVLERHDIRLAPDQLVRGQSVGQAFNFLVTGNAPAGFVALSQVIDHERRHGPGSRWLPRPDDYPPIRQEVVLLTTARNPKTAQRFLHWIRQDPVAAAIILADGYRLPDR